MTPATRDRIAAGVLGVAPILAMLLLAGIVTDMAIGGLPQISPAFLVDAPDNAGRAGGIGPILVATGWELLIGVGAALPVGLAAAIYLAEYGRTGLRAVRGALDLLSAVPSIVYGLFGMAFFCEALGLGWSLASGGLTVAVMILPLFARLAEAGLRAVPDRYRAAGHALGLPRWVLLRRVLLPQAAPALAAALVLATGRVLAESALFLFTAGASTRLAEGPLDPGRVLAVHVYLLAVEVPGGAPRAAATAFVLLAAVLASTLVAQALPRLFLQRRGDMSAPAALELRDVSVRYGARKALDGVHLAVRGGGITALVGPSGSGKTSLLHAVNRLHDLDDTVKVTGSIRLDGHDVRATPPDVLRTRIGLIFQQATPFPMSIAENLRFPLRAHGVPRAEIDGRVEAALGLAALWEEVRDRLDAPAATLSGGQQQRLCLARAITLSPAVLLLDEPCAALDPRSTRLVEDTLRALTPTTTLLLVTHNLAQARRLSDRCACLWPSPDGGRLVDEGPTDRVFSQPADRDLNDYFAGITG